MIAGEPKQKQRAWIFAHKLLSIVAMIPKLENKPLLIVSTAEIGRAMGVTQFAIPPSRNELAVKRSVSRTPKNLPVLNRCRVFSLVWRFKPTVQMLP
jgi:hypothetical protein